VEHLNYHVANTDVGNDPLIDKKCRQNERLSMEIDCFGIFTKTIFDVETK